VTLPFFWYDGLRAAAPGDRLDVTGDEARHAQVKRLRAGEQVVLTDGAGTSATVSVVATDRASMTVTVEDMSTAEPEMPRVVVVQAIPKGDRGELAVEMLTEVGVDVIVPWAASRSVAVWRGDKAAKQARRTWFPEVADMVDTAQVAALLRDASVPVVLHEAASGPIADLPVPGRGEIVIVVGPEGGISDEELTAFSAVGAEPVRLGSSVLRTSTAGVAATAALLARTRWR